MKRVSFQVLAFAAGFIVIAGLIYFSSIAQIQGNKTFEPSGDILVKVRLSGGLCADGMICSSVKNIYSSGDFTDEKRLSADQVETLQNYIESSDLINIQFKSNPSCPSFSDGQDLGFSFPQKYGETVFTVCQIKDVESIPVFNYLIKLLNG